MSNPHVVPLASAFKEAFAHEAAGRDREASAIYRSILAAVPEHPGALLRIALMDWRDGQRPRAREVLDRALAAAARMRLPTVDILMALARLAREEGRPEEAKATLERALAEMPSHAQAQLELALLAFARGDLEDAHARLHALTTRHPDMGAAWLQLALVAEARGRTDEAREAAATAAAARNTSAAAFEHAARLAWLTHDTRAAEELVREGLARYPQAPGLLHWQAVLQKSAGRTRTALQSAERAVALAPQDAGLRVTLGAILIDLGRSAEACRELEQAIDLGADSAAVWDNLGLARRGVSHIREAAEAFERAVARDPRLTPAIANLLQARQQMCDWHGVDELERRLTATLDDADADPRWPPWISLTMSITPAQQLEVARRWARAMLPPVVPDRPRRSRPARLRIGYISNDFREHPAGRLMVGVFELHDRSRFEVFVYSYGGHQESALRTRIRSAVDVWREIDDLSDADAARAIEGDEIDILVDRKGLTRANRIGILGFRPAPVQLHYQGYPGTIGYDGVDGLIADDDVIPVEHERFFHERVLRLPRSFFGNDARRGVPVPAARAGHGLPHDALVLACFNQAYKITAPVFATWMAALRAAPAAVLWLLATSPLQQDNLRRAARDSGVEPERIVFAPFVPQEQHMARLPCADLSLDTLPVNQHTTGCDSLWAGVPMITCRGATFAGRVGASLVRGALLPELITDSLRAYEERLIALVRDPARLRAYRDHLTERRTALPLFDTAGFVRDFEALLVRAYDEIGCGPA